MGGADALSKPLLAFGAPPDAAAWCALALGGAWLAGTFVRVRSRWALPRVPTFWAVALLAATAAALSAGYIAFYLRGGPRIIDATSYFLEGRAFAQGALTFDVPAPSGSFRGRFLVTTSDSTRLAVIFPPGYPAVLALGWWAGAPLAVGPAIAAALCIATAALALALFGRRDVAIAAAVLGVLSAALRYHTSDTMAHGLAALLLTTALLGAVKGGTLGAAVAGFAIGWLAATRVVTASVGLLAAGALVARRPRELVPFALALVPGVLLLLAHQHAATGRWFSSSQLHYYALADGPPGCFRYGFGNAVGCLHEHGDFARARLESGFGFLEALGTTVRRLWHHALDIGNFEPFALLLVVAAVVGRRVRAVQLLAAVSAGVVIAYVPFYFDATYPGGGARLYADALPLEHVLLGWGLAELRLTRWAGPASLLGFAMHASFSHRALAEREGGRPMFEPEVLREAGVTNGIVLVDTDHGLNLGHAPGSMPRTAVLVARATGDAHDRVLWELHSRAPLFRYRYEPGAVAAAGRLEPYVPPQSSTLRFEAEQEWPPLEVTGGWVRPMFPPCASAQRALGLVVSEGPEPMQVEIEVHALAAGPHEVRAGWVRTSGAAGEIEIRIAGARWRDTAPNGAPECWVSSGRIINLSRGVHRLSAHVDSPGRALDFVELEPRPSGSKANP